jgi:hypothetical protein
VPPEVTSPGTTSDPTSTISGTTEAGSTVTLVVDLGNGETVTYTTTADETGTWSVDLGSDTPTGGTLPEGGLGDGSYDVGITATDDLGNTASTTTTLTVDTATPTATSTPTSTPTGDAATSTPTTTPADAATTTPTETGTPTNTATATATVTPTLAATASPTATPMPQGDLRLTLVCTGRVKPGSGLICTLTYNNLVDFTLRNVTLVIVLPAGTTFNPDTSADGWQPVTALQQTSSTYQLNVGDIAANAGGSAQVGMTVSENVADGTTLEFQAQATSDDSTGGTVVQASSTTVTQVDETPFQIYLPRVFRIE